MSAFLPSQSLTPAQVGIYNNSMMNMRNQMAGAPAGPAVPLGVMGGLGVTFGGPMPQVQMPQLAFGGAFARGGIAPPGMMSLVGENGPEMIVPSGPTAVIPMQPSLGKAAPYANPADQITGRYAPGSLAGQPTRRTGGMTPARRMAQAERQLVSRGDLVGAAGMASRRQWAERFGDGSAPAMPAMGGMPMMAPLSPPAPDGKLVPGRSAGSLVFQRNAPPVIDGPMTPMPSTSMQPMPMEAPMQEPEMPNPMLMDPLGNFPNQPANAPAGFYDEQRRAQTESFPGLGLPPAGLYKEAPPAAGLMDLPGTDYGMVMKQGQPTGSVVPKSQPKPAAQAAAAKIPEGIQYEKDEMGRIVGGVYPTYNEAGKLVMRRIDLDGDGVVTPKEQAAAEAAARTTSGGFRVSLVK